MYYSFFLYLSLVPFLQGVIQIGWDTPSLGKLPIMQRNFSQRKQQVVNYMTGSKRPQLTINCRSEQRLKSQIQKIVKINDRGPHVKGRIIDLSGSAFSSIAIFDDGVIEVKI